MSGRYSTASPEMVPPPSQLAYYRFGDRGPPLILLHGLLGSKANMAAVARELAGRNRVFALDLRNHGDSLHAPSMTYEGMAADVLRFLDEHQLEKAALIGHSMGGKCAMQLALSHPLRIERLVVVDIAPRGYPQPFWQGYLEAMSSLELAGLATREDADLALRSAIASRLYRQFLLSNLNRSPKGGYFWKVNLKALLAGATTLAGEITARGTYDGPALFMRGGCSKHVRCEDAKLINRLFPASRLVTIEGAGHLLHIEAKERFIEELVAFL